MTNDKNSAQASDEPMPVAWAVFATNRNVRIWFGDKAAADLWKAANELGGDLVPLFAATPHATAEVERDEVLEDAAKLCDAKFEARRASGHPREASAARTLAREIRELKSATKGAKP